MTEEFVQLNVRVTKEQRKLLRKIAEEKEISMNQYIVDSTFNKTNGTNDVPLNEVLKERLKKQDEQIEKLQKALDQQQHLTLQSNQQIERLQLNEPADPEKKKGFFSRWFRL